MSLESKIEALTAAIDALRAVIIVGNTPQQLGPVPTPPQQQAPTAQTSLTQAMPTMTPPAPTMPAPPTFAPPQAAPQAPQTNGPTAPFSDAKGLMDYVMGAYKTMGPQKGAKIQQIMQGMGCSNIADVKPDQYARLHTEVEALKAAP